MDEVAQLHEKVEKYTDIDFQTVYIPVFAVAAWIWWRLIRAGGVPRALLVGGAAAWADRPVPRAGPVRGRRRARRAVRPMAITEEILEMAGSTMFLLAVVILFARTRAATDRPPQRARLPLLRVAADLQARAVRAAPELRRAELDRA